MTTFSPSKRSYPPQGTQASGAIVFASLFILLGLGVGGLLGLHAYVHRSDPPVSLVEIPSGSTVPRQVALPVLLPSAESTTAPSAEAPPAKPIAAVWAVAVSRTTVHEAVAAVSDKAAASEAVSDNPYP
jgi:hypothetical protein